jgi:hypothetical protein
MYSRPDSRFCTCILDLIEVVYLYSRPDMMLCTCILDLIGGCVPVF